jgi:hypothetical protein
LSSGLPSLNVAQRLEAKLLLTEAMQEQGRPLESLRLLESISEPFSPRTAALIDVLSLAAHQRLADIGPDNAASALSRLERIAVSNDDPFTGAKALSVAALLISDLQQQEPARHFLELSDSWRRSALDAETDIHVVMARTLLRQVSRSETSFAELRAMVDELRTNGIANLAAVQLVHCSSAFNCAQGKYELGLEDALLAQKMAVRLGNDLACASAAANLALCNGRLGNYPEQVRWAAWGEQFVSTTFTGHRNVRLGLARAFGSAMQGDFATAQSALAQAESRFPAHITPWLVQAWQLGKADVLQLCGLRRDALREAAKGLNNAELHNDACAGPFARWLSLAGLATNEADVARTHVRELRRRLSMHEAIDRVEILAADLLLTTETGKPKRAELHALRSRLSEALAILPIAVTHQLQRLGMPMSFS